MKSGRRTILDRWQITPEELTQVIDDNPSLRGMIIGYLAETKLRYGVFGGPEYSGHHKHDDHDRNKKGDLVVEYKGQSFTIECKSLQSGTVKHVGDVWEGKAQCDASDRRIIRLPDGSRVNTTCLQIGEFDVLAVCLFAFEEKWQYVFAKNFELPRSSFKGYSKRQKKYLISTMVAVTWPPRPPFYADVLEVLESVRRDRG